MGGAIKQLLLSLLGAVSGGHRDKRRRRCQLQAVELRVRVDCERCEREVKKALAGMRGVKHVEVNKMQQKVTVTGNVDPHKVLRRAQSTGKKAEFWPQNRSYTAAAFLAHDRWAPAIYPRNVEAIGAEQITNLFSDDNPNACSIM